MSKEKRRQRKGSKVACAANHGRPCAPPMTALLAPSKQTSNCLALIFAFFSVTLLHTLQKQTSREFQQNNFPKSSSGEKTHISESTSTCLRIRER
jgi:hypothetical protein